MTEARDYAARASELRLAFDRSFQEPFADGDARTQAFLAIHVRSDPYALRMSEISGLFVDRKVTRLPGPVPELLGIAGFRGAVIPVYCLGRLLGYEPGDGAPRWLVTTRSARPVGLVFHALDEHLRVGADALRPRAGAADARRHVSGVVEANGVLYSVLDMAALVSTIEARAAASAPEKESAEP